MKVLWFEVTEPVAYSSDALPIGGWQDSLQNIVSLISDIELCVAFMSEKFCEEKTIDGIHYKPIFAKFSLYNKILQNHWDVFVSKFLPSALKIINDFHPDLIHIFGTEWPFGQIAKFTDIPVVVHIQGAIVPYNNAQYPPNYSVFDRIKQCGINPKKILSLWKFKRSSKNREKWESDTWKAVTCYMGRTDWDKALSNIMHPGRKYYHVDEALRPVFLNGSKKWMGYDNRKIKLISTGCSSFLKGPDMMLKVAKILKSVGVDFEWLVAGEMPVDVRKMVERKEGTKFSDCNITILGFLQPDKLVDYLISSTFYIHTAYIENSPNSICEAQCVGIPVISTNVGGISSLVRHKIDGILVPANDPWQMANAIVTLSSDGELMKRYSVNSQNIALMRHNPDHILSQLLNCYNSITKDNDKDS